MSTTTSSTTSTDRIEKQVLLRAPRSKVWRALTDSQAFGEWFGVKMTEPFTPGARVRGAITHPGYEHLTMEITIERMEPEGLFSWRWHPNAIEPGTDYSAEPTTLVEFRLEDPKVPIKLVHKMTERQVVREMEVFAELEHTRTVGSLPWQHVIIFTKKEPKK